MLSNVLMLDIQEEKEALRAWERKYIDATEDKEALGKAVRFALTSNERRETYRALLKAYERVYHREQEGE